MTEQTQQERIAAKTAEIAQQNTPKAEPEAKQETANEPAGNAAAAPEGVENTEGAAPSDGKDAPAHTGKKPGVHQRIDELTREKYEARREAEQLKRELEAIKAEKAGAQPAKEAPRPTLDQFDFDTEKHAAAVEAWALEKAQRDLTAKQQKEAEEKTRAEQAAVFQSRVAELEKVSPGAWQEAITAPINFTPAMLEVIATSERGPEIAVHLSKHLDEAHRISTLSPVAAAAALVRIEAGLSAPAAQPAKPVSKAPAPPATLAAAAPARKEWGQMSTDEHIREWKARQQNNR